MYSKADIFNLALGALLLTRRITDTATDKSNECAVLNVQWTAAFNTALADMDLDATAEIQPLELVQTFSGYDTDGIVNGSVGGPNGNWSYAYKYPGNCAKFRRIVSGYQKDNSYTHIPKRVGMYMGQKVIFTDQYAAYAEVIGNDIPLTSLPAAAGMAIAYRLAFLSSPLITGKGADSLRKTIGTMFQTARAEAQGQDQDESFSYDQDWVDSEFVAERMS